MTAKQASFQTFTDQYGMHRDSNQSQINGEQSNGFRQQNENGMMNEEGTDYDFGRFSNLHLKPEIGIASTSTSQLTQQPAQFTSTQSSTFWPDYIPVTQSSYTKDGADVLDLLSPPTNTSSSKSLTDAIYADWEMELDANRTVQSWKKRIEQTVPRDPVAPMEIHRDDGRETRESSPTSTQILSSLSYLSLAEKESLKSFISQHESSAISDLLAQGFAREGESYTDAVWGVGLSDNVKNILSRTSAFRENVDGDNGEGSTSSIAKRRLRMIMRHLHAVPSQKGKEKVMHSEESWKDEFHTFSNPTSIHHQNALPNKALHRQHNHLGIHHPNQSIQQSRFFAHTSLSPSTNLLSYSPYKGIGLDPVHYSAVTNSFKETKGAADMKDLKGMGRTILRPMPAQAPWKISEEFAMSDRMGFKMESETVRRRVSVDTDSDGSMSGHQIFVGCLPITSASPPSSESVEPTPDIDAEVDMGSFSEFMNSRMRNMSRGNGDGFLSSRGWY